MTDTLDTAGTTTESGTQDATQAATETTVLTAEQDGTQATASADTPAKADDGQVETPTEYEPFAVPEGFTADEELLGEFKAAAKELKLSQEDAQKFADLGAKMQAKQADAYRATQQAWVEATKTDKEFGGDSLMENIGIAKKAMAAFATPELTQLLNTSGFGNHPEIIRAFYRVGKAISEDNRVVTGSKAGSLPDPAKRLFPNQI